MSRQLFYIVNARIPTEKAHGLQIVKTCEAIASLGVRVVLLVPKRKNNILGDAFLYYGAKRTFPVEYIPALDLLRFSIPFAYALLTITFAWSVFWRLLREQNVLCYVRGEVALPLSFLLPKRFTFFLEVHEPREHRAYATAFARAKGIITVTEGRKKQIEKANPLLRGKVVVARNGADPQSFLNLPGVHEARSLLSLPKNETIALYTGSDLSWKGTETLEQASEIMPPSFRVYLVGNITQRRKSSHCIYVGWKSSREIPLWLAAADVLILTGTGHNETSSLYTSPIKMFEYMASGKPIVAPSLPSFLEVLNETNCFIVPPDDPLALAQRIEETTVKKHEAALRAARAKEDVRRFTWEERARAVVRFMEGEGSSFIS